MVSGLRRSLLESFAPSSGGVSGEISGRDGPPDLLLQLCGHDTLELAQGHQREIATGMRAAGVPARGLKGKTCRLESPASSTSLRLFWNMASVSVGKPAIKSAPKAA